MALPNPTNPSAFEVADPSFEIEQGHLGRHLSRPNWELVCSLGGALLLLIAFPAVVGLMTFAINMLWYRRRANMLSCG